MIGLFAALAALTIVYVHRRTSRRKVYHPPSPTSLPLLGNLLAMSTSPEHLQFMNLCKGLNSDILFLELLGNNIVVLDSAEVASDLLEKRSALYSDRFCPPILKNQDLLDWSKNPAIMGYNDTWRHHRRMMNNWLNSRAVVQFNVLQEHQTRLLLRRLLDISGRPQPFDDVKDEFLFTMASSMFQLAYGYHIQGRDDPFFKDLMEMIDNGTKAAMFTNFYVNLIPALARVPDWFPGAGWKQTIRAWREQKDRAEDQNEIFNQEVGLAEPSIIGDLLQNHDLTSGLSVEERDTRLKELGVTIFSGGTDTTATTLVSFVAAMVANPQVQAKAQQEIDTVLGPNTLPTMLDRMRLPYVNNLILEILRWRPVAPIAIPHVCCQDDVYRGYDILQGTIVMGNIWSMSRNENHYPDPEAFNPDRFLDSTVPHLPAFGWGRRMCPGIHFGEASLFIAVASLLSAYTFSKKKDERGDDIEPRFEDTSNAIVLGLKPFEFEFKPRSERHRQLLEDSA